MKVSIKEKQTKVVIAILICVVAVVVALCLLLRKKTQPAQLPTVNVEEVQTQDIEIYGDYVGRVRAQQFVEIRARVEGYLEKMLFEEGTYVEKGQVLFVIDPQLYRAKVDRAKAQLEKDKAVQRQTKRNAERIRPLFEQNAASQLDLDNANAAYDSAIAEVLMSEADLAQAQMALGYTTVRSPISGFISERNVDVGTVVGPGSKSLLATIIKSDTVRVDFSLTELEYLQSRERKVQFGQRDSTRSWNPYVTLTLADKSTYPFQGFVDFADPQVDPQTGTFMVRAEMPNPDNILLPGQTARVKLSLDLRENAIVVPARAVIIEKGGTYVYVIRANDTAEKRFVELGPESGNKMVVERGLARGERIVVDGYHKLSPGVKVEVAATYVGGEQSNQTSEN